MDRVKVGMRVRAPALDYMDALFEVTKHAGRGCWFAVVQREEADGDPMWDDYAGRLQMFTTREILRAAKRGVSRG